MGSWSTGLALAFGAGSEVFNNLANGISTLASIPQQQRFLNMQSEWLKAQIETQRLSNELARQTTPVGAYQSAIAAGLSVDSASQAAFNTHAYFRNSLMPLQSFSQAQALRTSSSLVAARAAHSAFTAGVKSTSGPPSVFLGNPPGSSTA